MDKDKCKKFVQDHIPFSELKKVGFFPKEMKFNDYVAITKRVLQWFGFERIEQYTSGLPRMNNNDSSLGSFPDEVTADGKFKSGGGFHISLAQRDYTIWCPICDCCQKVTVSRHTSCTEKKCKGCKRKIIFKVTKEGVQVTEKQ